MIDRWDDLRQRRLVHVVAAAGYGKTTAVRDWLDGSPAVWGSGWLPMPTTRNQRPGWLIVDDLPADSQALARLRESLVAVPAGWRVVAISRWPSPSPLRGDGGPAVHVGPADLALPAGPVTTRLEQAGGRADPHLAADLHDLTAGWPALVDLACRQLADGVPAGDRLLESLTRPGTPLVGYLTETVLAQLPANARRLLRELAELEHACTGLLGPRRAGTLRQLARAGLVVPATPPIGAHPAGPGQIGTSDPTDPEPAGPWYRPVPLVAAVVRAGWPVDAASRRRYWRAAGDWYQRQRLPGPAARALLAAGEPAACARLLRAHGSRIVAAGGGALVAGLATTLPEPERDRPLRLVACEALAVVGDSDAALAQLTDLVSGTGPVDPAIAWRQGAVHYLRADRDAALAVLHRGRLAGEHTRDEALLLAQLATVHWSLGASDLCGQCARRALRAAEAAGDLPALAAARVALALHAALVGDRAANAAHYERALAYAERGGDVIQSARIRANQVSLLLEEARYPDALAAADPAVTAAEAAGYASMVALAVVNRATALSRLGRLDQAERDYRRAIALNQRIGSAKVAYPLIGLGDLHAIRGEQNLARAAYEEAIRVADTDEFLQCLIPALAGLAKLLAGVDPSVAESLAERATQRAIGPLRTLALLAHGWVSAAAGDRARAREAATAAADSARAHRDRAGLAEALELRAACDDDPVTGRATLREAARTWQATGARLDSDRVARWLGESPGATDPERAAARVARARLEHAGITVLAGPPVSVAVSGPAVSATAAVPAVAVRTLGRFEVLLAGVPVPVSGWQSRKARDLLRMLVARRGRMVPREELCAQLWADEQQPPAKVSHRLSVALSTLRSVLDPHRREPPDHYVRAGSGGIGLDLGHLYVDLESFLADAGLGLRLHADGRDTDARPVLAAARRDYAGDFCEDEPYDDWSVPAREEARAAYLRVLRILASLDRAAGRVDEAADHLRRILDRDPYDEQCHRDLVRLLSEAGRHGEARRATARYRAAMRELGVAPDATPRPPRPPGAAAAPAAAGRTPRRAAGAGPAHRG